MTAPLQIAKRTSHVFHQPISVLGFGGSLYASFDERQVLQDFKDAIQAAFEAGINHFDTAQSYGDGQGERIFGGCLSHFERERYILASKMLLKKGKDETVEGVKASLRNLATNYLDLFYIHWPAGNTDPRPMMEGLEECRRQGLIRHIGVSNFSVEQLEVLREAGTVDVVQLCYNLLWRRHEEDLIPYCAKHGIGIFSYSSLAQGILTGKYPKEYQPAEGDARRNSVFFRPDVWPTISDAVAAMQRLADESGATLVELAMAWLLRQPAILSIIVGARSSTQIRRNIQALFASISDNVLDRLTDISDELKATIPDTGNIFQYYPE
ncbi:aldo/keto reductase [Candidatus Moduliflexus flocculans]|uniref:Aldo/keto reductase n=1 Tax=Candidatus Moduliflexus flocculans TaxID=1499966 RepID=A0A0S6VSG7_9BACT|nr:aldo/keto reductase [Candidatus Moduliflexus flocculans]